MRNLFIYFFVYLSVSAVSQDLSVDWGVCFGDSGDNSFSRSLEVLPNGNIITAVKVVSDFEGFTDYHGSGDPWVLILDNMGNIIQERCFGGSDAEYFGDIEVTNEHIYFIGQTHSTDGDVQSEPIGGNYNLWVVKTDFDLNIIWERQYGCLGTQDFKVAKLTPEGGLILLMDFFNQGGGDVSEYYGATDIWVCEIDANGEILWEKTLGNSSTNRARNIIQNEEGNIVVLGITYASGGMIDCEAHGGQDIWIIEIDSQTQEIIWQSCYGGSDVDTPSNLLSIDGGYMLIGITASVDGDVQSNNHGGTNDAWLLEIDESGQLLWERCFGGSENESFKNIYETEDGGYLLFGTTSSTDGDVNNTHCPYPNCFTSVWVVELDSEKNILWNGVHGSIYANYYEKNGIKRISERDFYIAGIIDESTFLNPVDVECEPYPINSGKSAWIYRLYDPSIGIEEYTKRLSLKAYPNPATSQFIFDLPATRKESLLQIKNIFGQTISEIPIIRGQSHLIWECCNVSSGVYFYQTEIDGINYSGKIIIQ